MIQITAPITAKSSTLSIAKHAIENAKMNNSDVRLSYQGQFIMVTPNADLNDVMRDIQLANITAKIKG